MKKGIVVIALGLFYACSSSTSIVNSWKDPDVKVSKEKLSKVMVAILTKNETARIEAEDELVRMNNALVASHTLFAGKNLEKMKDEVKATLSEKGFDGIIALRLITKGEDQTWMPDSNTLSYWGWHDQYWGSYYGTGYYREDTHYLIETNVFSLKRDKLIWYGVTTTTNPSNLDATVKEVMKTTYSQMVKDGLIVK